MTHLIECGEQYLMVFYVDCIPLPQFVDRLRKAPIWALLRWLMWLGLHLAGFHNLDGCARDAEVWVTLEDVCHSL